MTSSISVGFFSPSSLSGCVLWLDASSLGLANGATVSTWSSLGPVSYTTTSTAGRFPTYATNIQGGRGCVQYATGQTTVLSNFVLAQTMSIFQLSYPIGQAFHPFLEHGPDENTNPGFYFYSGGGNNLAINSGTGQVAINVGNVGVTNTWLMQGGLNKDPNAANTMGYYSNGTLVASNGIQNGTTPITNTLFLNGRNNTNTLSVPSYVAELIIYSNALNNFGRQQVEGYLAWKWGLTSLLPATHPYKFAPYFTLIEQVPRPVPINTFLIPVNTFSTIKTFTLPVASTNSGRMIVLKDYLGYSSTNAIRMSTSFGDIFEQSGLSSLALSCNYGAWWFNNDGVNRWYLTSAYLNTLYLAPPPIAGLTLIPAVRYSFLSDNYTNTATVSNIGSNSAVGAATVVKNSYTSANPGFITNVRASQYTLTPSLTFRTIILITRVRDTASPSYYMDGRPGMGNGFVWTGGAGSDWTGTTYYLDSVNAAFPSTLPTPLNDSQWHHVTMIAPANYTTAMTFFNRFSFNEGTGLDCGEIMMFTQILTAQQVKENYNFFAARFGLTPAA